MPGNDRGTRVAASANDMAPQNNAAGKNPFSDVQNILGFLLAGFAGIISFLGLRSTEVTTVLRNDPGPASLIAAVLLVGVLAAVLTVVIDSDTMQNASWADALGIAFLLIGLADFIIFAIPSSARPSQLSEVLAPSFGAIGIAILSGSFWVRAKRMRDARGGAYGIPPTLLDGRSWTKAKRMSAGPGGARGFRPTIILLMIGVTLIALSAYGAMRLETASDHPRRR